MLANRAPCPLCTTLPLHCWWKGFWKDATEFFCHSNVLKYCPCPVTIPAVGSRTFNPPEQHKRTDNFSSRLWTTTEMLLEGWSRCCFHGLLGNVAIARKMLIYLMSVLRKWLYWYLWINSSALTYFNISPRVGYRFALPHSVYSIIFYWIIKYLVIIHPLKSSDGKFILA